MEDVKPTPLWKPLLFTLVLITVAEVAARAFLLSRDERLQATAFAQSPACCADMGPNQDLVVTLVPEMPYRVRTNNLGFRREAPTNVKKTKPRALLLGDSMTFGVYVNNQDAMDHAAEAYLKKKGVEAEVLNMGIPGYNLEDELSLYLEKGRKMRPDVVFVNFFVNDVSDYQPWRRAAFSRRKPGEGGGGIRKVIVSAAKRSAALSWLVIFRNNRLVAQAKQDSSKNAERMGNRGYKGFTEHITKACEDLKTLNEEAGKDNAKLVFVSLPESAQVDGEAPYTPQEQVLACAQKEGIATLDLMPTFKQRGKGEELFLMPLNGHFSRFGNQVAGEAIGEAMATALARK